MKDLLVLAMKKIYYIWSENIEYEFYIGTGFTRIPEDLKKEIEEMVVIHLAGRRISINKRGRMKKFLLNPQNY